MNKVGPFVNMWRVFWSGMTYKDPWFILPWLVGHQKLYFTNIKIKQSDPFKNDIPTISSAW